MLVSWDWLKQYVDLDMSIEELTDRLTMSGLNLEEYNEVDGDWVIDLEVTSNRPDCLCHLGVAREVAVLYDRPLKQPDPRPAATKPPAAEFLRVSNQAPEMCSQYHARVIEGVRIGRSPDWMQRRLKAIGIASVNNVVDITNYVMLECAQPLHAFDGDKLRGGQIIVRAARSGEKLRAINQRDYELTPDMCVIADGERPVALAGVMGGFDTEISDKTTTVVIEAAMFAPLPVRNAARKLDLHSPSSHRFERALDPQGPDYASRRCCELILQLAGGTLREGVVSAGEAPKIAATPIPLRFDRFEKILGISVSRETALGILQRLGFTLVEDSAEQATFAAPSYRRDVTREIDLVEEVARIHGYDHLPSDVVVPLRTSSQSRRERVVDRIGEALTSAGFYEAVTTAFVSASELTWFRPLGERHVLAVDHSSRRQENLLRQSLIPSLLTSRRANERHGNLQAQLFEIAKVYLSVDPQLAEDAKEPWRIGLVTGRSYLDLKGVVELLVRRVAPTSTLRIEPSELPEWTPGRGARLLLNDIEWGWLGELSRGTCDAADLRDVVCVTELDLATLEAQSALIPRAQPLPEFPSIVRDLNFVLDEPVRWAELEEAVRVAAGPLLESVQFGGQYRGKQLGEGVKSYVVTLTFRAPDRTLTSETVDVAQQAVIAACQERLKATLRA